MFPEVRIPESDIHNLSPFWPSVTVVELIIAGTFWLPHCPITHGLAQRSLICLTLTPSSFSLPLEPPWYVLLLLNSSMLSETQFPYFPVWPLSWEKNDKSSSCLTSCIQYQFSLGIQQTFFIGYHMIEDLTESKCGTPDPGHVWLLN